MLVLFSGCPLRTETGTMEGEYGFVVLDEADGHFKDMVDVKVGRFKLSVKVRTCAGRKCTCFVLHGGSRPDLP